jgi:hypothetical protein
MSILEWVISDLDTLLNIFFLTEIVDVLYFRGDSRYCDVTAAVSIYWRVRLRRISSQEKACIKRSTLYYVNQ